MALSNEKTGWHQMALFSALPYWTNIWAFWTWSFVSPRGQRCTLAVGAEGVEKADRPGRPERKAGRAAETWWAMQAFCSLPSVCCGLGSKAKGTSPVLCSLSQSEAARQPILPQTLEPPIMQGHNSLANKVAEHLALWILSKSLQIHYENGSNWTDIWIPEAQGHSFVC